MIRSHCIFACLLASLLPHLQALDVVNVNENLEPGAGLASFAYFGNAYAKPTIPTNLGDQSLISNVNFELRVYSPQTFEGDMGIPQMDDVGTLTFAPAYGFYGDSIVGLRLVSNLGRTTPWSNFTIRVHAINQAPAFHLRQSWLYLLEDAAASKRHHFAFNISKGLFPEAAELGVYYSDSLFRGNEGHQHVTFALEIVDGNQVLFERMTMTSNGTFEFKLSAHEYGFATIRVNLVDDGGMQGEYDQDTSQSLFFNVVVSPVNDPPIFSLPENITLLEQNKSYVHESYEFIYNWFWSDFLGNFQGPANELRQNITFTLEHMTGTSIVFDSPPILRSDGTMALNIGAYSWGETILTFSAQDDGGTENGGQNASQALQSFALRIHPVNTQPTIGSPREIFMWMDAYEDVEAEAEAPVARTFMVVEKCCSPCPGPQPCFVSRFGGDSLNEANESGGCSAPDDLGTLYIVPRFNSSAGPYEDGTQTLTFTITENGNSGLIDRRYPLHINSDGSLMLKLKLEAGGETDLDIAALDDGTVDNLPHQAAQNSRTQRTRLSVLVGFVNVTLQVRIYDV